MIEVEVLYAPSPARQELRALRMDEGATAAQALEASGLYEVFPELRDAELKIGIHARLVERDTPLRQGDRVEVYRPLQVDPKEGRRTRAAEAKRRA